MKYPITSFAILYTNYKNQCKNNKNYCQLSFLQCKKLREKIAANKPLENQFILYKITHARVEFNMYINNFCVFI